MEFPASSPSKQRRIAVEAARFVDPELPDDDFNGYHVARHWWVHKWDDQAKEQIIAKYVALLLEKS